jgi:hypothetical protein
MCLSNGTLVSRTPLVVVLDLEKEVAHIDDGKVGLAAFTVAMLFKPTRY